MKLLLDLQGAQSQSRHRGIGRYTLALSRAFLDRATSSHDIKLLFNARFDTATDSLIANLGKHAHPAHRVMLNVPEGIRAQPGGNMWLRQAAARTMRHAIEELNADVVWHSSGIEGYNDDAILPDAPPSGVSSVATLYDLIPLHDAETYLGHPRVREWYMQSVEILRRSDRLFAISEWVRQDAIERLGLAPERVVTIGAGVDACFRAPESDPLASNELRQRYGILRAFVLYNGGFDARKNVAALIHAFAQLPETLRKAHQLVIVGRGEQEEMAQLRTAARKASLPDDSVVFTGFIADNDLICLYAECALFVFPSVLEGFGLPPLEAMACGAPTIVSNAASLPEVVDRSDARFDPHRVESISERMNAVLGNTDFTAELRRYGQKRATDFRWSSVAERALDVLEDLAVRRQSRNHASHPLSHRTIKCLVANGTAEPSWLTEFKAMAAPTATTQEKSGKSLSVNGSDWALYIADLDKVDSLEEIMSKQPGVLLLQNAQDDGSTAPNENLLHAAYKGNGYPGILALRDGKDADPILRVVPLLPHTVQLLCVDAHLAERLRLQAASTVLPKISLLPNGKASRACQQQVEHAYRTQPLAREECLLDDINVLDGRPSNQDVAAVAGMIVTTRPPGPVRQWLVDVSGIAQKDIGTGVQRLVRNILIHWLKSAPEGVRIEPVRFADGRYHYARRYALNLLGITDISLPEDAVEAVNGDIFIGLDWAVDAIAVAEPQLRDWHRRGVSLQFIVNDLLPLTLPAMFHPYSRTRFEDWLRRIASIADRLVCISHATADDLSQWLSQASLEYQFRKAPHITTSPLGADPILGSAISKPRAALANMMRARPTLLMVGTIEPRKGYDQALDACELLWNSGADFNLVIVGHFGWLMETFRNRFDNHSLRNDRLFWIDDADDTELDAIYRASTALLAASWGEGYGLPLIEASRRGLPVIARDLPVFKEVMGEHAQYFSAVEAEDLFNVLRQWLKADSSHRSKEATQWPTWEQSAAQLAAVIRDPNGIQ